ncbi:MAG: hypothetical protein GX489_00350, partial [Firmicutes bacterium]|nr:hypothetical protein [Bacillota bacterium]
MAPYGEDKAAGGGKVSAGAVGSPDGDWAEGAVGSEGCWSLGGAAVGSGSCNGDKGAAGVSSGSLVLSKGQVSCQELQGVCFVHGCQGCVPWINTSLYT